MGSNNPIVGVADTDTVDRQAIGNIPAAPQPGKFDLIVRTRLGCVGGTNPTDLWFTGATKYGGP